MENKRALYEKYRDYFTCKTEDTHPGSGIFVLIREGFVSWLTRDGPATPAGASPGRYTRMECKCDELVNLLATIAIDKGVHTDGV